MTAVGMCLLVCLLQLSSVAPNAGFWTNLIVVLPCVSSLTHDESHYKAISDAA